MKDMNFFGTATPQPVQESYNASSSSYSDLFGEKFNGFDPANIVTGNNSVKSGQFLKEVEEGPLGVWAQFINERVVVVFAGDSKSCKNGPVGVPVPEVRRVCG